MAEVAQRFTPVSQLANKVETHAIKLALGVDDIRAQLKELDEISGTVPAVITSYFATLRHTLEIIAAEIKASEQSLGINGSPGKQTMPETISNHSIPITEETEPVETAFFSSKDIAILAVRIDRSKPPRKEWDALRSEYTLLNSLLKMPLDLTEEYEILFEARLIAARRNRNQLSPMETELLKFYDQYCWDLY